MGGGRKFLIESLINTVIQDDCLNVMKSMPDKCVDIVLTDPPYGIGRDGQKLSICKNPKHNRKQHNFKGWDANIHDKEYFDEIFRISKNQIIFGGNYFTKYLIPQKGWIVWDKGQYGLTMSDGELIFTSLNIPLRILKYNRVELLKDNTEHPTQKPRKLIQDILQNYSEPGMTIFDPFAGSGTTAIACLETGRNYILVEKEPEYVEIINKRIDTWKEQGRLFPAHVI